MAKINDAIGISESFVRFQEKLSRIATIQRPVLIIGERGTGKELAARRLHYLSKRWQNPLISFNCAAMPSELIESELFGYEAGAFTGAAKQRVGRFEAADTGTLFLDEIGSIPLVAQEKVLRAVEYSTFERVGSSVAQEVDVRIIAATNADLPHLVAEGKFKADLLDRLAFEVLHLPPLRERREDIILLANHFAVSMAHELGRDYIPEFSDTCVDELLEYEWPGNIRELKNVVERAVCHNDALISELVLNPFPDMSKPLAEKTSEEKVLAESARQPAKTPGAETEFAFPLSLKDRVSGYELAIIKSALKETHFNQRKAASVLSLTYNQFRGLYRKYEDELLRQS